MKIKRLIINLNRYIPEKSRWPLAVLSVLAIATLGYSMLHASDAASITVAVEAEAGTLTGNAKVIDDTSASGGQAVEFTGITNSSSSNGGSSTKSGGGSSSSSGGSSTGSGPVINLPKSASNECALEGGNVGGSGCYFWGQGIQTGLTATGAQVTMSATAPQVSGQDYHADSEMYVGNSSESYSVEVCAIVGPNSSTPHLLIDYWKDGGVYDNDFVAVNGAPINNGDPMPTTGTYVITIKYVGSQWQVYYNNQEVGYYPESVWGNNVFTQAQFVDIYGEVEGTSTEETTSQMGNGLLGTDAGSAYFSNYSLIGTSTKPDLSVAGPSGAAANVYKVSYATPTGFHYGGPGF